MMKPGGPTDMDWRARNRLGLAWITAAVSLGCASVGPVRPVNSRELVVAYDDARAVDALAFSSNSYESVVRVSLPRGEHQPLRLRYQAKSAGQFEITIYDSTILETPGDPLEKVSRELAPEDLSDGTDGHWVVEDLAAMKPVKGVIWIGVHKTAGSPALWTSNVVSGQSFIRNNDPQNPMGLLPTKRTPMLRLELAR